MKKYYLGNIEVKSVWKKKRIYPFTYLKKKNLYYVYVASLNFLYSSANHPAIEHLKDI